MFGRWTALAIGVVLALIPMQILLALPAVAESVAQAVDELRGIQNDEAGIDKELPSLRTKLSELGSIQRGREQEHEQIKTQHDAIQRDWDQRRDAFNGACSGRMLYGAEYNSCRSRQASLEGYKRQIEPRLAEMENRAKELERQFQETRNDITLTNARIQKLSNYRSQLDVRIRFLVVSY